MIEHHFKASNGDERFEYYGDRRPRLQGSLSTQKRLH